MSVSRKHFEWAAEYVAEETRIAGEKAGEAIGEGFAALFRTFNDRFDRNRFNAKIEILIRKKETGR